MSAVIVKPLGPGGVSGLAAHKPDPDELKSLAMTLGVDTLGSPLDLVAAIRKGLKKEAIDFVACALEVSPSEISRFLHVSPRTLSRYKPEATLSMDASDHLVQICKVYEKTMEVFGDRRKALGWLKRPCLPIGGMAPFDLLDTSAGLEMTLDELGRIQYGVFA